MGHEPIQICPSEKLDNKYEILRWADNPFPQDYRPELDRSKPLDAECSSLYQHLIGVMHWMVELGHVDIATEVSLLSSHLALPCEGHLLTALHVMGYLRLKHNSRLIFDPTYPIIEESRFPRHDWFMKPSLMICPRLVARRLKSR
jgi:hypothetical protein